MNFKEAYIRLQEIQSMLQSDELIDLEEVLALHQEAKKCYELCAQLLLKAETILQA